LQALLRRHPLLALTAGRPGLVEHEYRRRGTLAYLAAIDVHDPQRGLFGRGEPKIGNDALRALVGEVMSTEPYASAQRVFWVVDNGIIHRGQKATDRASSARRGCLTLPRKRFGVVAGSGDRGGSPRWAWWISARAVHAVTRWRGARGFWSGP
jgi:hypothetical protein